MSFKIPENSRIELKFITQDTYYHSIKNWIRLNNNCFMPIYKPRYINNIYFDDNNLETFSDNLFGNTFRAKFRYRWYDDLEKCNNGNFEIKFKRNIYGWKEKFKISGLEDINKLNWKKLAKRIKLSLTPNNKIYFNKYNTPSILNRYYREYYLSHDKNFRITLDRKLNVYDQRAKPKPNIKSKVLNNNHLIIEVKFNRNMRYEINDLLDYMPIRNSRNSKYINSIRQVSGI